MDHIAILDRKGLSLESILTGEKTIESRFYKTRKAPYGKIYPGDTVYFKEKNMPVSAKAEVEHVLAFRHLDEKSVRYILKKYAEAIGIPRRYDKKYLDYKYAVLIFFKDTQKIKPFNIEEKSYNRHCSWITLDNIGSIKKI